MATGFSDYAMTNPLPVRVGGGLFFSIEFLPKPRFCKHPLLMNFVLCYGVLSSVTECCMNKSVSLCVV